MKISRRQRVRRGLILVSFFLFPITMFYFSPVLIIEGAARGIVTGSFVTFLLLLLSAFFLGRGFCGWVCPGAGLQEACTLARDVRLTPGKRDWIKYFIWVPWIGGITAAAISAGGLHAVDPFFQTDHGISIAKPSLYIIYYFFLALIVVLALTAGRRAFCHYVCWMAPFMVLGRAIRNRVGWPSLRLRAVPDACKDCRICTRNCPMSLDVMAMVKRGSMESAECILCGTCADTCPRGAIRLAFRGGTGR
jgi:ferredoxin-type protein NapH